MNTVIPAAFEGERIDRVVATITGMTRAAVAGAVKAGAVLVDGVPVKTRSQPAVPGQTLELTQSPEEQMAPQPEAGVEFGIAYEDEHLVVVDKPEGLVVHPGAGHPDGTLVNGLLHRFADLNEVRPGEPKRPGIVHRLDAGTTGLLVVARNQSTHDALVQALKDRLIERRYVAMVWGSVESDRGAVDAPIGRSERHRTRMTVARSGKEARTSYEVVERRGDPDVTVLRAKLDTGRTHQIRVHFAALGHPLVGDRRYGGMRQSVDLGRPFLHAGSLQFDHPVTGQQLQFTSKLPSDLATVLERLSLASPDFESQSL